MLNIKKYLKNFEIFSASFVYAESRIQPRRGWKSKANYGWKSTNAKIAKIRPFQDQSGTFICFPRRIAKVNLIREISKNSKNFEKFEKFRKLRNILEKFGTFWKNSEYFEMVLIRCHVISSFAPLHSPKSAGALARWRFGHLLDF